MKRLGWLAAFVLSLTLLYGTFEVVRRLVEAIYYPPAPLQVVPLTSPPKACCSSDACAKYHHHG